MTESGTQKCVAKILVEPSYVYECGEPCEYVTHTSRGLVHSGWYHVDRSLTADHHAVPESMIY
jgi:hypothetical protein